MLLDTWPIVRRCVLIHSGWSPRGYRESSRVLDAHAPMAEGPVRRANSESRACRAVTLYEFGNMNLTSRGSSTSPRCGIDTGPVPEGWTTADGLTALVEHLQFVRLRNAGSRHHAEGLVPAIRAGSASRGRSCVLISSLKIGRRVFLRRLRASGGDLVGLPHLEAGSWTCTRI